MARLRVYLSLVCVFVLAAGLRAQGAVKKPSFDSGGVPIHYIVAGKNQGEPVLLIHGFTANIELQWTPVIKALTEDYKVIALDCRGHGGSGKPHDPKKYGLEMVKDAVRLLDHLKIDKAHVVGYSMGGHIALQVAVRYPERVKTLTVGGAGLAQPERAKMLKALAESLEEGKGLGPLLVALTPKNRPMLTADQIKLIDTMVLSQNDTKALAAVLRGINVKDAALADKQIAALRVPVLALIGADDPLRTDVNALEKVLPALQVVVIDGADHITAFNRAEFVSALKGFLDRHRQAKR
jgi:pimeloyl-ACP methyl ester carboxylesterase